MKGFSIVEVIIVIAIFSILIASATPFFDNFISNSMVRSTAQEVTNIYERARSMSAAQVEDSGWSVRVIDNSVVIYQGDDYSARDTQFDEVYQLAPKVKFATTSDDVIFSKFNVLVPEISTTTVYTNISSVDIVIDIDGSISTY